MCFGSREGGYFLAGDEEEGFIIDLEGEAGEAILGTKNSRHTEAGWHGSTRHAWGVAHCPLSQVCQMNRREEHLRRLEK